MNSLISWYKECVARRWVGSPRRWRKVGSWVTVALLLCLGVAGFYMPASADEHNASEHTLLPLDVIFNRPINVPLDAVPLPDHPSRRTPGLGLYGGTLNNSTCDVGSMLAFLQVHGDKAAAWARVQGIGLADIPSYIAQLKPVTLRSRLVATSHGFRNGRPTDEPILLPAGTAILIDQAGTPRTLCYCGNPLTPDIVVNSVLSRCNDSAARPLGRLTWPGELNPLTINESTNYRAAVDIGSALKTPQELSIPGPTPDSVTVQVACVLNARLMPPEDGSLAVDKKPLLTKIGYPVSLTQAVSSTGRGQYRPPTWQSRADPPSTSRCASGRERPDDRRRFRH